MEHADQAQEDANKRSRVSEAISEMEHVEHPAGAGAGPSTPAAEHARKRPHAAMLGSPELASMGPPAPVAPAAAPAADAAQPVPEAAEQPVPVEAEAEQLAEAEQPAEAEAEQPAPKRQKKKAAAPKKPAAPKAPKKLQTICASRARSEFGVTDADLRANLKVSAHC
jgi:hypothetical protein